MPINLATPFNPGDLDPQWSVSGYQEVMISSFKLDLYRKTIDITCDYGNTVSGVFVKGVVPSKHILIADSGDNLHYTNMTMEMPEAGETIMQAAGRELYTWLLVNGYFVGS